MRLHKDRNIGNVIFVVEGGRAETGGTELRLLKKIFADILDYNVQELRRGSEEFIGHGKNNLFHVFALNLPHNQLTELTEEVMDGLFQRIKEEFKIKPEDCPIFFLYDRDVGSYQRNILRGRYVKKYTDPYGTDEGDQGQLLLSYPAIESFLLSCIREDVYQLAARLGSEQKGLLNSEIDCMEKGMSLDNHPHSIVDRIFTSGDSVAEKRLLHAITEMDKAISHLGVDEYDLDNLAPVLLSIYDAQQEKYDLDKVFSFLSPVGMALLELGVIVEEDERTEMSDDEKRKGEAYAEENGRDA